MIIFFLYCDHREWDVHLNDLRFAYNTAIIHPSAPLPRPSYVFLNLGYELKPAHLLRRRYDSVTVIKSQDEREWLDRVKTL